MRKFSVGLRLIFVLLALIGGILTCVLGLRLVSQNILASCENEQLSGNLNGKELTWKVSVEKGVGYPPLVIDEFVVVIDRQDKKIRSPDVDTIYAYERESGDILWRYPSATAMGYIETIKGNSQYLVLNVRNNPSQGQIIVLNLHSGTPVLEISDTAVDVAINSEVVAYQDLNRAIHLYDLVTKTQRWETPGTNIRSNRGLYFRNGKLYSIMKMQVVGYDLISGMVVSTRSPTTRLGQNLNAITASLLENMALFASGTQLTYLDAETGQEFWSVPIVDDSKLKPELWQPASDDSSIYLIKDPFTLLAISKRDGTVEWTKQPDNSEAYIAPVGIQGHSLYAMWSNGSLHQIDIETQVETGTLSGPHNLTAKTAYWYYPGIIVDDEVLFVTFGCKTLYAFRATE